ncbi:MAG: TonB family protein [Campylobacterota bacterium]|nr:TonB family protein [Campylobacterota bacterium]
MDSMIRSDESKVISNELYKVIDFVQPHKEKLDPETQKELPPEPKPKEQPPKTPTSTTQDNVDNVEQVNSLNIDMPNLGDTGMRLSGGAPKMLQPVKMAKIDSVLTPMVQIKPVYPSRARRMGVEGYVKARLNVDEAGLVTSVEIVDAKPKGTFNKAAMRALKKWKFRPKTVDGRAVKQTGVITLKFNLGNR